MYAHALRLFDYMLTYLSLLTFLPPTPPVAPLLSLLPSLPPTFHASSFHLSLLSLPFSVSAGARAKI